MTPFLFTVKVGTCYGRVMKKRYFSKSGDCVQECRVRQRPVSVRQLDLFLYVAGNIFYEERLLYVTKKTQDEQKAFTEAF